MRQQMVATVAAIMLVATSAVAQDKPKDAPKEPSTEQKQQLVIAFQQARIAALEAEKADQAAKALLADIQAKVCGDGLVLSQALVCEKPK